VKVMVDINNLNEQLMVGNMIVLVMMGQNMLLLVMMMGHDIVLLVEMQKHIDSNLLDECHDLK
jgi:hypothetical protein